MLVARRHFWSLPWHLECVHEARSRSTKLLQDGLKADSKTGCEKQKVRMALRSYREIGYLGWSRALGRTQRHDKHVMPPGRGASGAGLPAKGFNTPGAQARGGFLEVWPSPKYLRY